eukprot:1842739-Alexandrium_andersonii.AAC.1
MSGPKDSRVCFEARKVLRLGTGCRRIPLEDLAPAAFNRHGAALSGKHVLALGERILKHCLLYTSDAADDM